MEEVKLKDIPYSLEIDEEGYPMFSGLRVDDEELLQDIFSHLRRALPEEERSKIITCMEGNKYAWIDAFDVPLVAQDVVLQEKGEDPLFEWQFLGGLKERIHFSVMSVDEWNKVHAYVGKQRIPAVLSRKAHARFLEIVSGLANAEALTLRTHRMASSRNEKTPAEKAYWEESYTEKFDGWELGEVHPYLGDQWNDLQTQLPKLSSEAHVLVPGAGRGHEAQFFSQFYNVTALDFASQAKESFESLYPKSKVHYKCANVLDYLKALPEQSIDAIFEHTFYCAIPPSNRAEYRSLVERVLKPGAYWFGFFFLLEYEGGPPFATTQWELRESIKSKYLIKEWHRAELGPPGRLHKELWAVLERV